MNLPPPPTPGSEAEAAELSIGDLADRTGVSTATLRVWEARYGFPSPQRRASGHRRYTERDVVLVDGVLGRRDAGTRLDVAIEQVLSDEATPAARPPRGQSVFAQLRRTYPGLLPYRLKKSTLLALSWAIEDEVTARANRGHLFGAFQHERNYLVAESRWREMARTAASTFVFADFATTSGSNPGHVALVEDSAMRREWTVVSESPEVPVALTAWELPGQQRVRDADRLFESVWTIEADAVREAARVCAGVAVEADAVGAREVAAALESPVDEAPPQAAAVTGLFNRVIAYIDTPPY